MTEKRLLSHFGLSPRVKPLGEPLDDIMFSKLLMDEHPAFTTPPNTRSSRGTSTSRDKRRKRFAATQPGSSSKRQRPSSAVAPPASSTRHAYTLPPPLPPLPRDCGGGSFRPPSSPAGGCMII
ncbi:UNVERIFIED_CONTAM: hypothetical protein Sradi_0157600 [Sesamum radiatum]|uniref:Uncharacterized protein n=1 Tax=Sesamum radiatum TaxID=300843 RepID=A0AAW2WNW5_SESRA